MQHDHTLPQGGDDGTTRRHDAVAKVARWIPNRRLREAAVEHPWMTFAGMLSMFVPLIVAFIPADRAPGRGSQAGPDEPPMPGRIEIHGESPGAQAYHGDPGLVSPPSPAAAPHAMQSGWELPQNPPGAYAVRHAAWDNEREAGGVETVGSNRPAAAPARGAWLTGTIEDSPSGRPSRQRSLPR